MKRIFYLTLMTLMVSGMLVNAQLVQHTLNTQQIAQNLTKSNSNKDIPSLINELKSKGYVVNKEDVKDIKDLERYLILDAKLKSKQDSVNKLFTDLTDDFSFLTSDNTDIIQSMQEFANMDKNIKDRFKRKNGFYSENANYLPKFLDDYEKEINNRYDNKDFKRYLSTIVNAVKQAKNKQSLDSVRIGKEKTELASLPTKATINTKFRSYTHKTGNVFEWFPVGFNPKSGKGVVDTYFGRKAKYSEYDENGIIILSIEYYKSGSVQNVMVYKGGNMIYYADYRDNAKQAFEIRSHSNDGKFYVVHKRIYDISTSKMNVSTKYQYEPLDYWYE